MGVHKPYILAHLQHILHNMHKERKKRYPVYSVNKLTLEKATNSRNCIEELSSLFSDPAGLFIPSPAWKMDFK